MKPSLPITLCLFALSCARGPGVPFATLEPSLTSRYVVDEGLDAGGGFARLSSDFQVRVDELRLEVEEILLQEPSGGGGTAFDPSKPPEGCSICHGGHCDCGDEQIPYEEFTSGGGGAATQTVATLFPAGEADFLAANTQPLSCDPATCDLPFSATSSGSAHVHALRLLGSVRDGRAAPRLPGEIAFTLVLTEAEVEVGFDLDLPANNVEAPTVTLQLDWLLSPKLFARIEWDALDRTGGTIDLNAEANAEAREQLLTNLKELQPTASIARR